MTIEKRLASIEARLYALENRMVYKDDAEEQPETEQSVSYIETRIIPSSAAIQGNMLAILGTICFIVASGFIIKLYVPSDWFTPERRVMLSGVFGIVLIVIGNLLTRYDKKYDLFLSVTGLVILHASIYSYCDISMQIALLATLIPIAISILLYIKTRYVVYLVTSTIGSYGLILFLRQVSHIWSEYDYYTYVAVALWIFVSVAVWAHRSQVLIIAIYGSILAMLLTRDIGLVTTLQAQFNIYGILVCIFIAGICVYRRVNGTFAMTAAIAIIPALITIYCYEYGLIDALMKESFVAQVKLARWIMFFLSIALLIGIYLYQYLRRLSSGSKKYEFAGGTLLMVTFINIAFIHSLYFEILTPYSRQWVMAAIFASMTFVAGVNPELVKRQSISYTSLALLAPILISVAEYCIMLQSLRYEKIFDLSLFLVSIIVCGSLWVMILKLYDKYSDSMWKISLLVLAHISGILGLWHLTYDINSLAVSVSWLFYAVASIIISYLYKDSLIAKSAALVLLISSGKALLYDASGVATLLRILCLLLTGFVLYICGLFIKKTDAWKEKKA